MNLHGCGMCMFSLTFFTLFYATVFNSLNHRETSVSVTNPYNPHIPRSRHIIDYIGHILPTFLSRYKTRKSTSGCESESVRGSYFHTRSMGSNAHIQDIPPCFRLPCDSTRICRSGFQSQREPVPIMAGGGAPLGPVGCPIPQPPTPAPEPEPSHVAAPPLSTEIDRYVVLV